MLSSDKAGKVLPGRENGARSLPVPRPFCCPYRCGQRPLEKSLESRVGGYPQRADSAAPMAPNPLITNHRQRSWRSDHRGQIGAVVPRTAASALRQQKLLIQIRHNDPLQPMPPRQRLLPAMVEATHEKRADRPLRQTRGVHADASFSSAFSTRAAQATHGPPHRLVPGLNRQPSSSRCKKRYSVVKSGTLVNPSV